MRPIPFKVSVAISVMIPAKNLSVESAVFSIIKSLSLTMVMVLSGSSIITEQTSSKSPSLSVIDQPSSTSAADLADAFLRDQGAKDFITCNFQKDGLVVGDVIAVTNTPHSFTSKLFYVNQLGMRHLGGSIFEYQAVMRNKP